MVLVSLVLGVRGIRVLCRNDKLEIKMVSYIKEVLPDNLPDSIYAAFITLKECEVYSY